MESKRQSKKERQPFLPREQRRPGGQREPAEGGFSPLFLSHPVSLSPHPHPGPASVVNAARLSASPSSRVSRSGSLSALPASASLCGSRPRPAQKQARSGAGPFPRSPSNWKGEHAKEGTYEGGRLGEPAAALTLPVTAATAATATESSWSSVLGRSPPAAAARSPPSAPGSPPSAASLPCADLLFSQGPHPLTAMTSLPTTSSPGALPGEELMTTPILQAPEALSPEAEASTALIAEQRQLRHL
ncbi:small cell adhesion glycoprotein isoform X2 [Elephas maximus indicus]|uniref:small cell adhesion glycoprotein isoform X2 n=1 Tax=Elephas maximus indicus TaxID=99487 RepID=UPI0021165154|nr:small cell adhesion glycoprotein isoform X2 [Elephas maximus indicus]